MQCVVVGMGRTGLSLARHLARQGLVFAATDSRTDPPCRAEFAAEFPGTVCRTGGFDAELLASAREVLLSPGVDPADPALRAARAHGACLLGDIELFWRTARAPIVAITGTNAKSTVTTLVGLMAAESGLRAPCGGNLGTPALELLNEQAQLYVLELSSFQLDLVHEFRADVAAILNVAPDHLDRYGDMDAYTRSKQRIHRGARVAICNRDDAATTPPPACRSITGFGLAAPRPGDYGLERDAGGEYLVRDGQRILAAAELGLHGRHNTANALAALAIAEAAGIPRAAAIAVLRRYRGLPHRCQLVARVAGVEFYDDSKGTNAAAAIAALRGLAPGGTGRIVLIAGGIAKEHDFTGMADELARSGRGAVLIGRDAARFGQAFAGVVPLAAAGDMDAAVRMAAGMAARGDVVLLSPACASFDMFRDYADRGDAFARAVRALAPDTEVR